MSKQGLPTTQPAPGCRYENLQYLYTNLAPAWPGPTFAYFTVIDLTPPSRTGLSMTSAKVRARRRAMAQYLAPTRLKYGFIKSQARAAAQVKRHACGVVVRGSEPRVVGFTARKIVVKRWLIYCEVYYLRRRTSGRRAEEMNT